MRTLVNKLLGDRTGSHNSQYHVTLYSGKSSGESKIIMLRSDYNTAKLCVLAVSR